MEAWAESKCKSNVMFKYMYNILQLKILMLVRSMREANFWLFDAVLQKLAPYFVATDHTSFARWLSVFIHDLETLPVTNPNLYRECRADEFAVQSTCTGFSKMAFEYMPL